MSSVVNETGEFTYERWDLPELNDPGTQVAAVQTSGEPGGSQQGDYSDGFECGRREGLDAGRQAVAERVGTLEQLISCLVLPLEGLDQTVEEELIALALAVARQLAASEFTVDPDLIVTVVRNAMAALPSASRNIRIRLHPDDAELVRELLPDLQGNKQMELVADTALERGGCHVSTDTSQVDATVEARLKNIIAALSAVVIPEAEAE